MGEGSNGRDENDVDGAEASDGTTGSAGLDREGLLAENRARRAQLREDEEAKAARKAGEAGGAGSGGSADSGDEADSGDDDKSGDAGSVEDAASAEDAAADVAQTADAEPEAAASSNKTVKVLAVLTAVLAVVAVVLAVLLAMAKSDSSGDSADQQAVKDAKDYATTVLTYQTGDYSELDRRIRAISTPAFADEYIKSSLEARKGNDAAQATGTAKALEAGVISMSDDTAVVLVAIDQNVTSPLAPALAKDGIDYQSRLRITLTRDGDDWKMSKLEVV